MKILVEMMQDIHLQLIELQVTADSPLSDHVNTVTNCCFASQINNSVVICGK